MPTWQALKRCPDAVVIRPRMSHYTAISREIRSRMLALTPLVQPLSIDEAFLDLSGTEALHGCPPAEALVRLQRGIREEIGITVSIGLSGTKSLAKMASDRDKPDGFFAVDMDSAPAWLAPQPVSVLFGLGKAAVARLNAAGIETCGDLVSAPDGQLSGLLGRGALLCQKVSTRLKAQQLAGGRVTLKLKRPDHRILTRSQSLPERTDKAHVLFTVGRELLGREIGGHKSYRLLGIGADQLGPPGESDLLALADEGTSRRDNLEAAIDDLNAAPAGTRRYPPEAVDREPVRTG